MLDIVLNICLGLFLKYMLDIVFKYMLDIVLNICLGLFLKYMFKYMLDIVFKIYPCKCFKKTISLIILKL